MYRKRMIDVVDTPGPHSPASLAEVVAVVIWTIR
jgi:hypothetical protein